MHVTCVYVGKIIIIDVHSHAMDYTKMTLSQLLYMYMYIPLELNMNTVCIES